MKATTAVVYGSDTEKYDETLMMSNEVSTSSQWILNSACSHHSYCKEELFDSLESSKGTTHLMNGSSYTIKDIRKSACRHIIER